MAKELKLTYHTATFCYVDDLTNPDSAPLEVATMAIGEMPGLSVVVLVESPNDLAPAARILLEHLPQHVKSQLSACHPAAKCEDILKVLHSSLRNSLYISSVSGPHVISMPDSVAARNELVDLTVKSFDEGAPAYQAHARSRVRIEEVPQYAM